MSYDYGDPVSDGYAPDFEKDPNSVEDFAFNWVMDLNGDSITSSSFELPDGLTQVSIANDATKTQIFVSGGARGQTYRITNRIVTSGGRTFDKTIRIYVKER